MSEAGGSDRIQQDLPTASGTGDNSDLGTGAEDTDATGTREGVPLARDAALERDAQSDDLQPERTPTEPSLAQRADPT
ncbi:hypothetical protein [Modestobacter sp. KNN46-3]|uniref:hypothetical protein n=1 Tax=Modestobacter sp. KNN46-3 TaxID=2711218 RepID=UPI0013DEEC25|nr:hypothetical protein [Modestobacter sp. KNN46-3]